MKTWYIFRHGLATHADSYGDLIMVAPLLPEGRPAIERMGAYLATQSVDECYVSPIVRCQQTAEIITQKTSKKFITDPKISEYDERSEPFGHLDDRIHQFIAELQKSSAENIWICSHGTPIAGMKHYIMDGEFTENQVLDYPLPGQLIIIRDQQLEIKDFNL